VDSPTSCRRRASAVSRSCQRPLPCGVSAPSGGVSRGWRAPLPRPIERVGVAALERVLAGVANPTVVASDSLRPAAALRPQMFEVVHRRVRHPRDERVNVEDVPTARMLLDGYDPVPRVVPERREEPLPVALDVPRKHEAVRVAHVVPIRPCEEADVIATEPLLD